MTTRVNDIAGWYYSSRFSRLHLLVKFFGSYFIVVSLYQTDPNRGRNSAAGVRTDSPFDGRYAERGAEAAEAAEAAEFIWAYTLVVYFLEYTRQAYLCALCAPLCVLCVEKLS